MKVLFDNIMQNITSNGPDRTGVSVEDTQSGLKIKLDFDEAIDLILDNKCEMLNVYNKYYGGFHYMGGDDCLTQEDLAGVCTLCDFAYPGSSCNAVQESVTLCTTLQGQLNIP